MHRMCEYHTQKNPFFNRLLLYTIKIQNYMLNVDCVLCTPSNSGNKIKLCKHVYRTRVQMPVAIALIRKLLFIALVLNFAGYACTYAILSYMYHTTYNIKWLLLLKVTISCFLRLQWGQLSSKIINHRLCMQRKDIVNGLRKGKNERRRKRERGRIRGKETKTTMEGTHEWTTFSLGSRFNKWTFFFCLW